MLGGLGALVVSLAVYQPISLWRQFYAAGNPEKTGSGRTGCQVFRTGLKYLGLLAAGFLLYYGMWSVVCGTAGVEKRRVEESLLSGGGLGELLGLWQEANVSYVRGHF